MLRSGSNGGFTFIIVPVSEQVAQFVDMLPSNEQLFALEFIKRLVLAWDPDFTKVTAQETAAI